MCQRTQESAQWGFYLPNLKQLDLQKYQLDMNYNTFDFFFLKQRVYEYIVILRQTKFKNHHKTNNECEGEKGRHLSQKDATNSGRNSAGVSPSVRLLWEHRREPSTLE